MNITCQISPVSLLPLTKVVLSARSSEGYEFASSHPTLLRTWLFSRKPVLRNGFTYRLPSPHQGSDTRDASHEYSVILSEPVAQGYAYPSVTEILVSLHRHAQPSQPVSGKGGVHEDEEYIEIDQDFMANSILTSIGCVPCPIPCISTYKFATSRPNPGFPQVHIHPHRWHTLQDRPSKRPQCAYETFRSQQSWADQWGLGEPLSKGVKHRLIIPKAIIGAVDTQTRRLVKVAAYQGALPERYVPSPALSVYSV